MELAKKGVPDQAELSLLDMLPCKLKAALYNLGILPNGPTVFGNHLLIDLILEFTPAHFLTKYVIVILLRDITPILLVVPG